MSTFLSLNGRDVVKGLVLAVFAAIVTYFYPLVSAEDFTWAFNWQEIGKVVVSAVIAYFGKNFLSDKDGKILGRI